MVRRRGEAVSASTTPANRTRTVGAGRCPARSMRAWRLWRASSVCRQHSRGNGMASRRYSPGRSMTHPYHEASTVTTPAARLDRATDGTLPRITHHTPRTAHDPLRRPARPFSPCSLCDLFPAPLPSSPPTQLFHIKHCVVHALHTNFPRSQRYMATIGQKYRYVRGSIAMPPLSTRLTRTLLWTQSVATFRRPRASHERRAWTATT